MGCGASKQGAVSVQEPIETFPQFEAQLLIQKFYDSLNKPSTKKVRENVTSVVINDSWISHAGETAQKNQEQFIGQVEGFGKLLPDLSWSRQFMAWNGGLECNKYVCLSIASATPASEFMGVSHQGKSFSVYAIDIHTIDPIKGKLAHVHHVEDWATAVKQLKGEFKAQDALPEFKFASSAAPLSLEAAKAIVSPFYDTLTNPATKDVEALVKSATKDDWISFSGPTTYKNRDAFIAQVQGFGKLIPDLKWEIKDMVVDSAGQKIVVRSEASGTPEGIFMGVDNVNKKSFKIYAIDFHFIKDGKMAQVHHVEDWMSAIRQLKA